MEDGETPSEALKKVTFEQFWRTVTVDQTADPSDSDFPTYLEREYPELVKFMARYSFETTVVQTEEERSAFQFGAFVAAAAICRSIEIISFPAIDDPDTTES